MPKTAAKIAVCVLLLVTTFCLCVVWGSTGSVLDFSSLSLDSTILNVRIPRVLVVGLVGLILSVCGLAMQSLLNNPLADGSTIGISSGASLGAVIFIILGSNFAINNGLLSGVTAGVGAIIFSFVSLALILFASYKIDKNLSTNSLILIGVIFSMFASALINLLIAVFPDCAQTFTFWTMGSVVGASYVQCIILAVAAIVGFLILYILADQLDICTLGQDSANNLGVDVKPCRLVTLIVVSVLIGISVSICGTIAFVGLAVPHICRLIFGVGNKKLMVACSLFGAIFLMLCDLFSRTVVSPKELPIGVITSIVGAIVFIVVFYKSRKRG